MDPLQSDILPDRLPVSLRERVRLESSTGSSSGAGEFVLYWMRTAVRTDENPALDVARSLCQQYGCPLLIYQAISENYRYASDRHHRFMLEGARDVQQQCVEQGLSYAFHLSTPADRAPHLVRLSKNAVVVVTEDMPVGPPRRFLDALLHNTGRPVLSVDTACVVPMRLAGRAFDRAFQFRDAMADVREKKLAEPYVPIAHQPQPFSFSQLPFRSLDLQTEDLGELISRCEIDHAVGPVVDTVGGSQAGYQRWQAFRDRDLSAYAKRRNSPTTDGVSRMSAYLHYGMVSPFRLAREAARQNTEGGQKYVDELLIWRELAYTFCAFRDGLESLRVLPDWARKSLEDHADDLRSTTYSWEELARGKTEDPFWNLAQTSLIRQGELHNNVRMTWGKAILAWKERPEQALEALIDLNHRYALDGRDPASYGGILWCLGLFDRPFQPSQKIAGTIRPRPTSWHANRIDLPKYELQVSRPRFEPIPSVAIIGAGISGLIAARTLQDHGLPVVVLEKSRGVGGRMATRRMAEPTALSFDHGAQYFTARDSRFIQYVDSWVEQGVVARWPDREEGDGQGVVVLQNGTATARESAVERFVGTPSMNAVCKHLAQGLEIRTQTLVEAVRIRSEQPGWTLLGENGDVLLECQQLVVSAPAGQAANLLGAWEISTSIKDQVMNPCWALMIGFEDSIGADWAGAFVHGSFLTWVARNSSKPGRPAALESWVLHAAPDWTEQHWETDPDQVTAMMLAEFWRVLGSLPQEPVVAKAHRWKFAIPATDCTELSLSDATRGVHVCGDWLAGGRVEGAFLSGLSAAGRILNNLRPAVLPRETQKTLFS